GTGAGRCSDAGRWENFSAKKDADALGPIGWRQPPMHNLQAYVPHTHNFYSFTRSAFWVTLAFDCKHFDTT
ncbi:hypothetical protein EGV01_28230, partial [Pseudomonas syringae pv. theae]|nr:hypothetical protein [Pseudomonas syringae pv. theae]